MENFTPVSGLIGGMLIGLAAALLLLLNGRISGISGIVGGLLTPKSSEVGWRVVFIAGLLPGAFSYRRGVAREDASLAASPRGSGAPSGLRHSLWFRLHQRSRSMRHRTPFEALDRRLGGVLRCGDGNRVPYPTRDLREAPKACQG